MAAALRLLQVLAARNGGRPTAALRDVTLNVPEAAYLADRVAIVVFRDDQAGFADSPPHPRGQGGRTLARAAKVILAQLGNGRLVARLRLR